MDPAKSLESEDFTAREAARAPLAVATSIAVMFGGAAFLAMVTMQAPASTPPPAAAVSVSLSEAAPAEPRFSRSEAVSVLPAKASGAEPVQEPSAQEDGLTPRLSPTRIADANPPVSDDSALTPRLKPQGAAARSLSGASTATASVFAFGQIFLSAEDDRPPPFFFAEDLDPSRASRPPIAIAYAGDVSDGPRAVRVALEKGETFVDAMKRAGVRAADRNAAAYVFGEYQNLRALRPGQEFVLTTAEPNQTLFQLASQQHAQDNYLLTLDFTVDPENRISLKRAPDGGYQAKKTSVALTSRLVGVSGRIDGSLYLSAKHAGAPDQVIADLADVFAYDVDFQREIFGGDEFEAIFEVRYDENGRMVGSGDILYARLKWRGRSKEKGYYRFASKDGGRADFFDRSGDSARRLLMKTPIDGARLSSGFGTRHHPILGYARAHKGVDFAASRGTPIKAAGSGVVERANRYGSFGNYVRIRHANGYQTAYAHLNGFARGMRAGKRVDQGDIIGYVGTTGRSTGPHLHYEVHLNGQAVNPQNLKMATGVSLKGDELEQFKAVRDAIDAMRLPREEENPNLLAQDSSRKTSL